MSTRSSAYYREGSPVSSSSRGTYPGSVFSGVTPSTYRSISDRPDQGLPSLTFLQQFPLSPAPQTLPCEFKPLTGCTRRFQYSELDEWITHEAYNHMDNNLPAKVRCRLCDVWVFDSTLPRAGGDRGRNFEQRMHHMAQHLVDREIPVELWRPDFDLVKHVYSQRKISSKIYKAEMEKSEAPLEGKVAHDYEPREMSARRERSSWREHDLRKEERDRRKAGKDRGQLGRGELGRGGVSEWRVVDSRHWEG